MMSEKLRKSPLRGAQRLLLLFFFCIILPLWCQGDQPVSLNTASTAELFQPGEAVMKANPALRPGYHYAALRYELTPGASYTFEMSYPPVANGFAFSFLTADPLSPTPSQTPVFLFSKSLQNRNAPGKPNQLTRTRFRVKPESTGRTIYVLLSVDTEPVGAPRHAVTVTLSCPEKPGVNQAAEMPGWPEMGKLYFYDDSGDILLK